MTKSTRIDVPDEHLRMMYEDGLSQQQIADAIGWWQPRVGVRLRDMGVKTRPKGQRQNRSAEVSW